MVEISKDKDRAFLYFKSLSLASNTQVIEAVKVLEVRDTKKYAVRAYDYYEPGRNIFIKFSNSSLIFLDFIQAISTYELPNQLNCETSRFSYDREIDVRNNWNNRLTQRQFQITRQDTQRVNQ